MQHYFGLAPKLRWQDVLDILIVAYVIYRIAVLIRGTRTMQMVVGLLVVAGAFVGSQLLGLFTLNWLLNNFLGSLFVILVVIFQSDIRRALTRVGTPTFLTGHVTVASVAQELVNAAAWLSARRIGALIVLEQEVGLSDYVETGRMLQARLSPELLETIFMRGSPLHDGAVIINGEHVLAAACLLPLSTNPNVSLALGTRHRAAIGITEESDAVVIVVSEEDGTISFARNGELQRGLSPDDLLGILGAMG
ncbi:MAG TPA: diadenylate cyclase CdaA [Candidatus Binataceae bacterium]|jgi:diadenylate cyclase|nr:diadenylate cyclase CdaA [Candidatus Binataceae bacterium]